MIDQSLLTAGVSLGTKTLTGSSAVSVDTAQIYTDLSGIQQLKAQGKTDQAGALKNIAQQFEAMMVQMMMKSMRDANAVFAEGDMTASSDEKFYQDMFDNQLSLSLSKGRGFGIAEALLRQLQNKLPAPPGKGAAGEGNLEQDKTALTPALTRGAREPDRSAATLMSGNTDNPRLTAAIQDALYSLFGGQSESGGDKSATGRDKSIAAVDGTPENFVAALRPLAQRIAGALGVDGDVLISQSALETGWGQKVIECADGTSSFNFFNIKADENWKGEVVKVPTIEYQNGIAVREWASFRAYNSPEESFADYARLIGENPRYQRALDCAENPRAYIKALAQSGYATDPAYADKVLAIYHGENLR